MAPTKYEWCKASLYRYSAKPDKIENIRRIKRESARRKYLLKKELQVFLNILIDDVEEYKV